MVRLKVRACFMAILLTCILTILLTYKVTSRYQPFHPKLYYRNENDTLKRDAYKRLKPRNYVILTHDDPETYQGPVVQEWPPSKNRSVRLYIKESHSFNILPSKEKLAGKSLIIIIQSRPDAFEERQTNRDTWIKIANKQTSVIFLIGSYFTFSLEVQQKINQEFREHSDIIVAQDLIEDYKNLTLKTLYMLKYFLKTDHFSETTPKYLMKTDDDVFVNLPILYHLLTKVNTYRNSEYLLLGKVLKERKVLKVDYKPLDHRNAGKWGVPTYLYNGSIYPMYCMGSGYVLSRPAAECIYQESLKIPYFYIEDIFITGFAAEACGIKRISNDKFHTENQWKGRYWNNFKPHKDIMIHGINSTEKRMIFETFKDDNWK